MLAAFKSFKDLPPVRLPLWRPGPEAVAALADRAAIFITGVGEVPYKTFLSLNFDPSEAPTLAQQLLSQESKFQ
jgi:hypothetical protein